VRSPPPDLYKAQRDVMQPPPPSLEKKIPGYTYRKADLDGET